MAQATSQFSELTTERELSIATRRKELAAEMAKLDKELLDTTSIASKQSHPGIITKQGKDLKNLDSGRDKSDCQVILKKGLQESSQIDTFVNQH